MKYNANGGNNGDDGDPDDGGDNGPPNNDRDKVRVSPGSVFNTHNFEKYMKQEVSLTQLTHPYVYLFYNKLRHLSFKYGILLQPLHKISRHEPRS